MRSFASHLLDVRDRHGLAMIMATAVIMGYGQVIMVIMAVVAMS